MNSQIPRNNISSPQNISIPYSRRLLTAGAAATIAGVLSFAGITHAQESQPPQTAAQQEKHGEKHFRHGPMNPAHAEKRIEHRINRLLADTDVTPEQKAKIIAIARAASSDLRPLREKSRAAHKENARLLTQASIDRNAIEKVRQTEQQLADQKSRRTTQALADAAEVLTPAQRLKVAEKFNKRHGHHFGHKSKMDAATR